MKVSGVPRNEGSDAYSGLSAMAVLKGIRKMQSHVGLFIFIIDISHIDTYEPLMALEASVGGYRDRLLCF